MPSPSRNSPGMLLLTLGGIGFARVRPAMLGSAAAGVFLLLLESVLPPAPEVRAWTFGLLFAAVFAASIAALRRCVPRQDPDQQYVVVDEFLGMLVAMAPQLLDPGVRVLPAVLAFGVFRVIDSLKPFGIRWIDNRKTPASVLLDDVAAGLLTALLLWGVFQVLQMEATLTAP